MRSFCIRANMLVRTFSACSEEVKISLFRAFCSNMYCSQLWRCFDKKTLDKLRVIYNNALRKLMSRERYCSASKLFVDCNIVSFKEMLRKYVYSFKSRVTSSANALVRAVTDSYYAYSSRLVVRWYDVLYGRCL
jgi:hypothetical protein